MLCCYALHLACLDGLLHAVMVTCRQRCFAVMVPCRQSIIADAENSLSP